MIEKESREMQILGRLCHKAVNSVLAEADKMEAILIAENEEKPDYPFPALRSIVFSGDIKKKDLIGLSREEKETVAGVLQQQVIDALRKDGRFNHRVTCFYMDGAEERDTNAYDYDFFVVYADITLDGSLKDKPYSKTFLQFARWELGEKDKEARENF